MSIPYSTRLGVASSTSSAFVTIGTVPVGKRWIVKSLVTYQEGTGSAAVEVRVTGIGGRLWKTAVLAQDQWAGSDDRHLVLNAGEVLTVRCVGITGTVNANTQAHGYELDAP